MKVRNDIEYQVKSNFPNHERSVVYYGRNTVALVVSKQKRKNTKNEKRNFVRCPYTSRVLITGRKR